MKPIPLLACLVAVFAGSSWSGAVEMGASRDAVIAELGEPQGEVASSALSILYFARGEVRLTDGRVTGIALMSEDALAHARAMEAADAERRALAARLRAEALEAEGQAVRRTRLQDPRFQSLPAIEQLRLWKAFAVRYPSVPVADEITVLSHVVAIEETARLAEAARSAELAALEARIEAAESRAERAEREARRARSNSPWQYGSYVGRPYRITLTPPQDTHPPRHGLRPDAAPQDATPEDLRGRTLAEIEAARADAYRRAWPR